MIDIDASGLAARAENERRREAMHVVELGKFEKCLTPDHHQPAASMTSSKAGRSAGSFWPSPSRVTIHVPFAAFTPVQIAALCPQLNRSFPDSPESCRHFARTWRFEKPDRLVLSTVG